jgi:hypothetical protein
MRGCRALTRPATSKPPRTDSRAKKTAKRSAPAGSSRQTVAGAATRRASSSAATIVGTPTIQDEASPPASTNHSNASSAASASDRAVTDFAGLTGSPRLGWRWWFACMAPSSTSVPAPASAHDRHRDCVIVCGAARRLARRRVGSLVAASFSSAYVR